MQTRPWRYRLNPGRHASKRKTDLPEVIGQSCAPFGIYTTIQHRSGTAMSRYLTVRALPRTHQKKAKRMKSLIDLQNEIDSLQRQASEIRAKEKDRTVQEIIGLMKAFGISHSDLRHADGGTRRKRKARAKQVRISARTAKETRKPAPIKFRGPAGETWSGRGRTPVWLQTLLNQGQSADKYRVTTSTATVDRSRS